MIPVARMWKVCSIGWSQVIRRIQRLGCVLPIHWESLEHHRDCSSAGGEWRLIATISQSLMNSRIWSDNCRSAVLIE